MFLTSYLSDKFRQFNRSVNEGLLKQLELALAVISVLLGALGIALSVFQQTSIIVNVLFFLLFAVLCWLIIIVVRIAVSANKHTNPYSFKPATPPLFVGRDAELAKLRDALEKNASLAFIGKRRIGKSSLLKTWQLEAEKQERTVRYIDGQDKDYDLWAFVAEVIGQPELDQACHDPDRAAAALNTWAERQPKPPLLLLDEAELFISRYPAVFWVRMRASVQQGRLLFVFAGHKPLSEIYRASHAGDSPFDNTVIQEHLGLLDDKAARALIAKGGFHAAQQQQMRAWAGNHPFFLQVFGHELYAARRQSSQHLSDTVNEKAKKHLQRLWDSCNETEQAALLALARGEAHNGLASLRLSGLTTPDNRLFGDVWRAWLGDRLPDEARSSHRSAV